MSLRNRTISTVSTLSLGILSGVLLTGAVAPKANAQTSYFTTPDSSSQQGNYYIGFEFNATQSLTVSALGFIDATNSGTALQADTPVGLYSVSGLEATDVASVFIAAGTDVTPGAAGAVGAYWQDIAPVTIGPGNYVIMADAFGYGNSSSFLSVWPGDINFAAGSGLSFVDGWFSNNTFPGLDTNFHLNNQSGGPDYNTWVSALIGVAPPAPATPEPGSVAFICGMGITGISMVTRRRRLFARTK